MPSSEAGPAKLEAGPDRGLESFTPPNRSNHDPWRNEQREYNKSVNIFA